MPMRVCTRPCARGRPIRTAAACRTSAPTRPLDLPVARRALALSARTAPARPMCSKRSRCSRGQGAAPRRVAAIGAHRRRWGLPVSASGHAHRRGRPARRRARPGRCGRPPPPAALPDRPRHGRLGARLLSDYLRLVWLTPDLDGLFRGAAGDRRRFLDRLVLPIDPATPHARTRSSARCARATAARGESGYEGSGSTPSSARSPNRRRRRRRPGRDRRAARRHDRGERTTHRRFPGPDLALGRDRRSSRAVRPSTSRTAIAPSSARVATGTGPPAATLPARRPRISLVPHGPKDIPAGQGLHRRAEGAADRPRARPCQTRRHDDRDRAARAARRGRRPSHLRRARGADEALRVSAAGCPGRRVPMRPCLAICRPARSVSR